MAKVLFVVCQHGDEITPLNVIKKYFEGKVDYLIANPDAVTEKKRFIKTDLNRSFPGKKHGSKEERIANNLLNTLKKYDIVVDLHTATCPTTPFIIITVATKKHFDLARKLGVKKLVYMKKSNAHGRSLIDHVKLGISFEAGMEGDPKTARAIKKAIKNFLESGKPTKLECFEVYDFLKQEREKEELIPDLSAFKLVKKGDVITKTGKQPRFAEENFYPVMPRAKSYKASSGTLTLMARKNDRMEESL